MLAVTTEQIDDIRPLVPLVDARKPLVFLRRGQGIAGIGEALRLEFSGSSRFQDAAAAWKQVAAAAQVTDPLGIPGTGLVALGAFTFSDDSAQTSVLIVPSIVVGRRDGVSWITRIGPSTGSGRASVAEPVEAPAEATASSAEAAGA